jgi:hypothetical protein
VNSYARTVVSRPELMDLISVTDGRTHVITAADFERGLSEARGRYRAVCGAVVEVASMNTGPGAWCMSCVEHRRECERAATAAAPGPLARLVRRIRGPRPGARA